MARNRLTAIPVKEENEYGDYVATGCNINFAWIENTILFPQFRLEEDAGALALSTDYKLIYSYPYSIYF